MDTSLLNNIIEELNRYAISIKSTENLSEKNFLSIALFIRKNNVVYFYGSHAEELLNIFYIQLSSFLKSCSCISSDEFIKTILELTRSILEHFSNLTFVSYLADCLFSLILLSESFTLLYSKEVIELIGDICKRYKSIKNEIIDSFISKFLDCLHSYGSHEKIGTKLLCLDIPSVLAIISQNYKTNFHSRCREVLSTCLNVILNLKCEKIEQNLLKVQIKCFSLFVFLFRNFGDTKHEIPHNFLEYILKLQNLSWSLPDTYKRELIIATRHFITTEISQSIFIQPIHILNSFFNYITYSESNQILVHSFSLFVDVFSVFRQNISDNDRISTLKKLLSFFANNLNISQQTLALFRLVCILFDNLNQSTKMSDDHFFLVINFFLVSDKKLLCFFSQFEEDKQSLNLSDLRLFIKSLFCLLKILFSSLKSARLYDVCYINSIAALSSIFKTSIKFLCLLLPNADLNTIEKQPFHNLISLLGSENKELLDQFSTSMSSAPLDIFSDIICSNMRFLIDSILSNPLLLVLPQYFLSLSSHSSIFATNLLEVLFNCFLIEVDSPLHKNIQAGSIVFSRLYKLVFLSLSIYPDENAEILQPILIPTIRKLISFLNNSIYAHTYMVILRSLFRSIGGGKFELVYKEIQNILPDILESFNNLIQKSKSLHQNELLVELSLTIPVRLSILLPYLKFLMKPLSLSLQMNDDLKAQGLRTLELCLDNLTHEFMEPLISPVLPSILQSLIFIINEFSNNNSILSSTAIRIIGKLGGKSRKFLPKSFTYSKIHRENYNLTIGDFDSYINVISSITDSELLQFIFKYSNFLELILVAKNNGNATTTFSHKIFLSDQLMDRFSFYLIESSSTDQSFLLDQFSTVFPDKSFFELLFASLIRFCYSEGSVLPTCSAACLIGKIYSFNSTFQLYSSTLKSSILTSFKAILFVLRSIIITSSFSFTDNIKQSLLAVVEFWTKTEFKIVSDEISDSGIVGFLFAELASPNRLLCENVQHILQHISNISSYSISDLFIKYRNRFLPPIFTKSLKNLPISLQLAYIHAISFLLKSANIHLDFQEEVLKFITEVASLCESESFFLESTDKAEEDTGNFYKQACIEILAIALDVLDFQTNPKATSLKNQIVSICFHALYSKQKNVVLVSRRALSKIIQSQHKLPKDLMQAGLRPVLTNLTDPRKITKDSLEGLKELLILLTSYFKPEIGRKIIEHIRNCRDQLKKATTLRAEHSIIDLLIALFSTFPLLPKAHGEFISDLIEEVVQTESSIKRIVSSPIREHLYEYIRQDSFVAFQFFQNNFNNPRVAELFLTFLKQPFSSDFFNSILANIDSIINILQTYWLSENFPHILFAEILFHILSASFPNASIKNLSRKLLSFYDLLNIMNFHDFYLPSTFFFILTESISDLNSIDKDAFKFFTLLLIFENHICDLFEVISLLIRKNVDMDFSFFVCSVLAFITSQNFPIKDRFRIFEIFGKVIHTFSLKIEFIMFQPSLIQYVNNFNHNNEFVDINLFLEIKIRLSLSALLLNYDSTVFSKLESPFFNLLEFSNTFPFRLSFSSIDNISHQFSASIVYDFLLNFFISQSLQNFDSLNEKRFLEQSFIWFSRHNKIDEIIEKLINWHTSSLISFAFLSYSLVVLKKYISDEQFFKSSKNVIFYILKNLSRANCISLISFKNDLLFLILYIIFFSCDYFDPNLLNASILSNVLIHPFDFPALDPEQHFKESLEIFKLIKNKYGTLVKQYDILPLSNILLKLFERIIASHSLLKYYLIACNEIFCSVHKSFYFFPEFILTLAKHEAALQMIQILDPSILVFFSSFPIDAKKFINVLCSQDQPISIFIAHYFIAINLINYDAYNTVLDKTLFVHIRNIPVSLQIILLPQLCNSMLKAKFSDENFILSLSDIIISTRDVRSIEAYLELLNQTLEKNACNVQEIFSILRNIDASVISPDFLPNFLKSAIAKINNLKHKADFEIIFLEHFKYSDSNFSLYNAFYNTIDNSLSHTLYDRIKYLFLGHSWGRFLSHAWIYLFLDLCIFSTNCIIEDETILAFRKFCISSNFRNFLFSLPFYTSKTWFIYFLKKLLLSFDSDLRTSISTFINFFFLSITSNQNQQVVFDVVDVLLHSICDDCFLLSKIEDQTLIYINFNYSKLNVLSIIVFENFFPISSIHSIYKSLFEDRLVLPLCLSEDGIIVSSLLKRSLWSLAQEKIEYIQDKCFKGEQSYSIPEIDFWEDSWFQCAIKLQQWDLLGKIASFANDKFLKAQAEWFLLEKSNNNNNNNTGLDSISDNCKSFQYDSSFNPVIFDSLLRYHDSPECSSIFQAHFNDFYSSTVHSFHSIPLVKSEKVTHLFNQCQLMTEIQETYSLVNNLHQYSSVSRPQTYQELKALLSCWRERLPNEFEHLDIWSSIFTWRQHLFMYLNSYFDNMNESSVQPGINHPFASKGYHEIAWTINRFSRIARLNSCYELCLASLSKIYALPNIEVPEAFFKLKEQAKCYIKRINDLPLALDVINATNLGFFNSLQKSEFFALKAHVMSRLGLIDEANRVFSQAVQIDLNLAKAWALWGIFNDQRFRQLRDLDYAVNAINCFLQASTLLRGLKARKYLAKILWILSFESPTIIIAKSFDLYNSDIPQWYWLNFLQQLFSSISRNEYQISCSILAKLIKTFPQACHFAFKYALDAIEKHSHAFSFYTLITSNDPNLTTAMNESQFFESDSPRKLLEEFINISRVSHPLLYITMENFAEQLTTRLKHSPIEECLRKVTNLCYFVEGVVSSKLSVNFVETPDQSNILKEQVSLICDFIRHSKIDLPTSPLLFLNDTPESLWQASIQLIDFLYKNISLEIPKAFNLESLSRFLSEFQFQKYESLYDLGQFLCIKDSFPDQIRILSYFDQIVERIFLAEGTYMRSVSCHINDGSISYYLFQFSNMLLPKQEEMTIQFLRLLDDLLRRKSSTARLELLNAAPISIYMINGVKLLKAKNHLSESSIDISRIASKQFPIHFQIIDLFIKDVVKKLSISHTALRKGNVDLLNIRVDAFTRILSHLHRGSILSEVCKNHCRYDLETYWVLRKHFCSTFSQFLLNCYNLSIGQRYAQRMVYDVVENATLISKDFYPTISNNGQVILTEAVPFRLTPIFQHYITQSHLDSLLIPSICLSAELFCKDNCEWKDFILLLNRDIFSLWLGEYSDLTKNFTALEVLSKITQNYEMSIKRCIALSCQKEIENIEDIRVSALQTIQDLVSCAVNPQKLAQMESAWHPWL